MKRFFCTICQRIKRVRQYPIEIEDSFAKNPIDRIGVCHSHESKSESKSEFDWTYNRKVGVK